MSKADFASLKKLAMVDMGRVKHCGDDDIWRCRRMKWIIVLKATESFSNADLYEIYTNGYSAAHKGQIDKRQQFGCVYIGNRGQPLMAMLTMVTLMLIAMTG